MFSLIRLPYSYNVLEPYIDAQTMAIHHGQLHQMHVDKLNAALADYPSLTSLSILELLRSLDKMPEEIRTAVRNNAGGDACHTWFFTGIGPNEGGNPRGALGEAINAAFDAPVRELDIDGHRYELDPGDAYLFDSRRPHAFRNIGEGDLVIVSACTPPSF